MAENKVKLKRLTELQNVLKEEDQGTEILRPVRRIPTADNPAIDEDYDIGQSDNKSGRGMGWYVVHTYSGYEKKVKANIDKARENRHLESKILEVRVPEQEVTEIKSSGKKGLSKVNRKVLPGYVLIHMDADDNDAWYVVRNTRGVTGFVGPGSKPVPLEEFEVSMLEQEQTLTADFGVGELVTIISGAWEGTTGVVSRIDESRQTCTITVEMFGRETPVELKFSEVKKMD